MKVATPEQNVIEAAADAWPDLANESKKQETKQAPKKTEEAPIKAEQVPQKTEEVSASSALENILQHQEKEKALEEQKEQERQEPTTLE